MNMKIPDVIETSSKRRFTVGLKIADGDLSDIYSGSYANGAGDHTVAIKVGRDRRDNDLLENEASVLNYLYPPKQKDEKFYRYLPKLIDTATFDRRQVTIFPLMENYVSVADVLAAYPKGLDFRDMVWMYKRLLAGLGFVHEMGVVHGAILPTHVLVHPEGHGAKIIDWSYSLNFAAALAAKKKPADPDPVITPAPGPKKGLGVWDLVRQNLYADSDPDPVVLPAGPPPDPDKLYVRAMSVDYEKYYAPEILRKESPSPATDIFMAAKVAVALCGGDVEAGQLPDNIITTDPEGLDPARARTAIQAFLQASLVTDPRRRPHDAWQVHEDLDQLLQGLVGPNRFRKFTMPGAKP